jgi:hypothetical protein
MKTDLDIIAEQCAEIDRRNGDAPLPPVRSEPLLACPFCGSEAIVRKCADGYRVGCVNSGCICGIDWGAKWIEERNGIKAWNRRANAGVTGVTTAGRNVP